MIQKIISHMNDHHKEDLVALAKKFGNLKECHEIALVGVDNKGLDISCDGKMIRADFATQVEESELKNAIIELCMSVPKTMEYDKIKQEMLEFRAKFGSVMIASIDENHQAIASYAPLLTYKDRFFIYISEVAEHYASIKANPNSIEILFLEDEASAKSVILRKRLRYKTKAVFREKDAEFDEIFDHFEQNNANAGGLKSIRKWDDFHLVELIFQKGRFVKGFGAAYDIDEKGNLKFAAEGSGNPHKLPHK
ncbi:HugZ family heme oxygenase [Helicobacter pametensis]|uniref:HugZ family heme oxygenase n=1 Tax=Helicobacter pametensis TaxID=95149 RepID=UPI000483C18F|nr:HugZ family heme oxygenase [Helicobacter pametensis]